MLVSKALLQAPENSGSGGQPAANGTASDVLPLRSKKVISGENSQEN